MGRDWGYKSLMAITLLNRRSTRLRVREVTLPAASSPLLGTGIDVMALPEGHLSCIKCKGYKFEFWLYGDSHRVEMGCIECNATYRLLFPLDVDMPRKQGRFTCQKHPTKHFVVIHNIDILSIGCEACRTEINFQLKKKQGLIIADD